MVLHSVTSTLQWTMTRTSLLRTSKPSAIASFNKDRTGPPHRSDTPRTTPRTLPAKPEKSNKYKYQRGYEHVTSSATPSDTNNMVFGQRKFSAEPDSLAMTGTSLMQSPPSSLQTSNTFRPRSLVTLTLTMTMPLPTPLNMWRERHSLLLFATSTELVVLLFLNQLVEDGLVCGLGV